MGYVIADLILYFAIAYLLTQLPHNLFFLALPLVVIYGLVNYFQGQSLNK